LADSTWAAAPKAETFYDRQSGSHEIDQTVARILYDDKYIYVSFYCRDSQPDKILGRETIRDSKYANGGSFSSGSEDNVEVSFDPFQGHKFDDLSRFSVNAIGTRSARLGGGRANKSEWKGDWEAAAKRVADGWTAEMKIPWAILNYPNGNHPVTFGINFNRFQDRTKIQSVWSNTGPQFFLDLSGLWTGVQVPKSASHPKVSLLPYLLPNMERGEPGLRSGIDARYPVTPELTVVSSINPDFATIEGAIEGIQFSRSERFVQEKRPFFLEGADYLSAGDFFGVGRFLYTRRIETFDAGLKVYGKVTPKDSIGILNTIDFGSRNDIVARYRHTLSPTSNAGFFFSEKSAPEDTSRVATIDQLSRWGKFSISSQFAASGGADSGGSAGQVSLIYEDRLQQYYLNYVDVAPTFRAADGLVGYTDTRGIQAFFVTSNQWRNGFWRGYNVDLFPQLTWHYNGLPFQRGGQVDLNLETRSDWRFGLSSTQQKFDDQTDETYGVQVTSWASNRFKQWGFNVTAGRQANRPYNFIGPTGSVRILKKMDLAYAAAIQNFEGREQQHILTGTYEVSPTRSFGGRIVIQDANTNWYVSYRSSGEKGTEMFFIIGDPNSLRFTEKVAVKLVFAI
jgi:hypothetical protein